MISVNDRECIRRAYVVEHKRIREMAKELGHYRKTLRKALESAEASTYTLQEQRPAPILGSFKEMIDRLLEQGTEEMDPQKRAPCYWKIQQIIHDQLPLLETVRQLRYVADKDSLENFQPTVWGGMELPFESKLPALSLKMCAASRLERLL